MFEVLLQDIGLTKSEIAVYFALLELGPSKAGNIILKSGIASGKAYLVFDKLVEKGLITYSMQGGVKSFQAKDPDRLIDYLKDKESEIGKKRLELEKNLPKFRAQFEQVKFSPKTEVFEGIKGFKTFYEWMLKEAKSGECIDVLGIPKEAFSRFEGYIRDWHKRRLAKGIKMRILYNHDCKEFGKMREQMPFTEVKYMKPALETPAWIDIFRDYVVTINGRGSITCFLIKDKEVTQSYQNYFEMLWSQS